VARINILQTNSVYICTIFVIVVISITELINLLLYFIVINDYVSFSWVYCRKSTYSCRNIKCWSLWTFNRRTMQEAACFIFL